MILKEMETKKTKNKIKKKYTYKNITVDFPYNDFICNKKYKVIIVSQKRKTVPCFHIIDSRTMGYEFDCKISLTECRYLRDTKNILSKNQLKNFVKLLKKPNFILKEFKKNIYWQFCKLYNLSNYNEVDETQKIPEYEFLRTED